MRYLSVCSGIEAASVAWKPLGWECVGLSEIDKFPRAVLQHRLDAVPVDDDHRWQPGQNFTPLFGDFTKIEAHHVGPVDLLVGGTPCQSFSIAGKRLGLDDPRGNLTLEFLALALRVRARFIVWENVPGILSHDGGRTFGTFLGFVEQCGFRWAYRTIDAQYCRTCRLPRAVPQRRRRVFLVGYSGTADINPAAVLFDRESLRGNPAPRREAGQSAPANAGKSPDRCSVDGCDRPKAKRGWCNSHYQRWRASGNPGSGPVNAPNRPDHERVAGALTANYGEQPDSSDTGLGPNLVAFTAKDHGGDAVEDISPKRRAGGHTGSHANAGVMPTVAFRTTGNDGVYETGDVIGSLTTATDPNSHVLAFDMRGREGGAMPEGPHDTANIRAASGGSSRSYAASQAWGVRRLTPTECERLQGFPDGWTAIPWRGKAPEDCPDGPRYKALGNSFAVNVVTWIGERIEAVRAVEGEGAKE